MESSLRFLFFFHKSSEDFHADVEHTKLLKPQKYCKKGAVSLRQPLIINPIVPKHPYWTEWPPYKF